jgi:4-aminobutyrate--pyruvate transaminase
MLSESDKQGSFAHGYTYAGHPVTTAVALETLKIYDELGIFGHVKRVEKAFLAGLHGLRDHPLVGSAEGVGLIGGFEIVQDKRSRTAFPADKQIPNKIEAKIREKGVILRLIGNRLAFSPPLIINEKQIEDMFERIGSALQEFTS